MPCSHSNTQYVYWSHKCWHQSLGEDPGGGGVLPMWWVIHMCRGFDPLFSLWQDRARSFWGIFSHPPTPKRSFGVLKLPILKEFDLLGPKFHFSLDLFGSNFQRPAAHPHQFSDRVPPPPGGEDVSFPNDSFTATRLGLCSSVTLQQLFSKVYYHWGLLIQIQCFSLHLSNSKSIMNYKRICI